MFCKWCGMESETTDQCSYCQRPLSAPTAPAAASDAPPLPQTEPTPVTTAPDENKTVSASPQSGSPPALDPAGQPALSLNETASRSQPLHVPAPAGMPLPRPSRAPAPPAPIAALGTASPTGDQDLAFSQDASALGRQANSPKPHAPAPAIPIPRPATVSKQREMPPGPSEAGAMASTEGTAERPLTPAQLAQQKRAQAMADIAPMAEAGGLADGIAVSNRPTVSDEPPPYAPPTTGSAPAPDEKTAAFTTKPPLKANVRSILGSERPEEAPLPEPTALLGRFAAIYAGVLLLAALVAYLIPRAYVAPLLIANFVGGLLLPILRVVPWVDEDADDAGLAAVLTFAFGPAIALIIYGVVGGLRQSVNSAMIGCLSVALLARLATGLPAHTLNAWTQLMPFPPHGYSVQQMLINWAGLVALAGWYSATSFRKMDE